MNEINIVLEIAKEASEILMKYYGKELDIQIKDNDIHDLVTTADIESDNFIRGKLKEKFPNDSILSEENEAKDIDFSGRVWMVDPLDGTKGFVDKFGSFSVMIGLCNNGMIELGVVVILPKKIVMIAEKGKGAFILKNGEKERLKVSDVKDLNSAKLITRTTDSPRKLERLIDLFPKNEKIPTNSIAEKLGLIAEGKADFNILLNLKAGKWDTCAPQIILEEAGGKVTNLLGEPLDYKQKGINWADCYIGSNGFLHEEIVKKISTIYPLEFK